MALKSVIALFFISGFVGVLMRFTGEMTGIGILRDTLPIKAANAGIGLVVCLMTILTGVQRDIYAGIYLFAFTFLLSINIVHLFFSAPATVDAWNTIPFEAIRFFGLGWYVYAAFLISDNIRLPLRKVIMGVLYSCSLMTVFSILQGVGILPNFYFQWYGGLHLPRPTGGLEHPHFFALLMVMATCVAVIGFEKKIITKRRAVYFGMIFLIGILVSTSRVGLIAEFVFLMVYSYLRLDFSRLTVLFIALILICILATLWAMINWKVVSQWPIMDSITVFLSAFQESFSSDAGDGRFLRGRGERWAHEIELITASPMTLLFGYGHQPFVSHNLILRQLQVSGIIGTLCYVTMLLAFIIFWISNVARKDRAPVYAILLSFAVASITFPVLVSVTVSCGFVLLVALSIYCRTVMAKP